jgi:hypothetical protein
MIGSIIRGSCSARGERVVDEVGSRGDGLREKPDGGGKPDRKGPDRKGPDRKGPDRTGQWLEGFQAASAEAPALYCPAQRSRVKWPMESQCR